MATQKQYKYTLPIGYVLHGGENDYVIEEVLGKGGFGVTYKVKASIRYKKFTLDAFFALKEYFPEKCWRGEDNATLKVPPTMHDEVTDGIKDFINEGRKLQQVCDLNPNIVNVDEVFEANGTAYYVLEYLEGGDLRKMVRNNGSPLTEQQMLDVMVPIGRAIQCLHDNNILHLDIKPDNIVMRRNSSGNVEPVLIDFGIAVHFSQEGTPTSKTPSQGLSPGYSPIEQYMLVKTFDPRIDVYAYCATCLYLLTGKDPMEASFDLPANYVKTELPDTISANVATALEHGMSINKNTRTATINQVLKEFDAGEDKTIPSKPEKSSLEVGIGTLNLSEKAAAVSNAKENMPVTEQKPNAINDTDSIAKTSQTSKAKNRDNGDKTHSARKLLFWGLLISILLTGIAIWATKYSKKDNTESNNKSEIELMENDQSSQIVQNDSTKTNSNDSIDVAEKQSDSANNKAKVERNDNSEQKEKIDNSKQIIEIDNQIYMANFIKNQLAGNDYKPLPTNSGINNAAVATQIKDYNEKVLQRNSLVENSGLNNPIVQDLDAQLNSLKASIATSLNTFIYKLNDRKKALEKAHMKSKK